MAVWDLIPATMEEPFMLMQHLVSFMLPIKFCLVLERLLLGSKSLHIGFGFCDLGAVTMKENLNNNGVGILHLPSQIFSGVGAPHQSAIAKQNSNH